ncbi:DUF1015 [Desulfonema limicola]|uniref:DUF1015 n=1 Tax=Desulfonema limicola TaxID=45656 RepID=A0A975GJ96_9BACT|nr:DUF1015 domain-containing protein [Desulfonema limicola]QTA83187.1 DUF1015 [Desulfonema limicola]
MAEIVPFKGIMYNPEKIKSLADVTAPPYDVISPEEQEMYHKKHDQNIIRLILGKIFETDTQQDNRYTRAAEWCKQWHKQDILVKDIDDAFYFTSIEFMASGRIMTRYGLTACVKIEPFEKGIILPHEKTFSRVKSERLELMKAAHMNFSPIFALYSDPDNILETLKKEVQGKIPDSDFTDMAGHRQVLWRITKPDVHQYIKEKMKSETLFIADGHHRYETALNYRNWLAETIPDFSPDHPGNYVMMYLSSMQDPGMLIFPAHRLLKNIDPDIIDSFISKAEQYFDLSVIPFKEHESDRIPDDFMSGLQAGNDSKTIGVFLKNSFNLYLLALKPNVMDKLFAQELPQALRELDVTVLTRLIFMEILGFDQARLDNEKLISYTTIPQEAVKKVLNNECDMAFILNPTKIEQVQNIARQGLIMPRKSTYFYPKVITGQVLNPLKP